MTRLHEYTIDPTGFDWGHLLRSWSGLLPPELTPWIMNRFGDLFIVLEDGSVHWLSTEAGSLTRVAESRDHFCKRLHKDDNASNWLMIPLVDQLAAAGKTPGASECYSFLRLPILEGEYTRAIEVPQHFLALGPIHEKLKTLPDGSRGIFTIE